MSVITKLPLSHVPTPRGDAKRLGDVGCFERVRSGSLWRMLVLRCTGCPRLTVSTCGRATLDRIWRSLTSEFTWSSSPANTRTSPRNGMTDPVQSFSCRRCTRGDAAAVRHSVPRQRPCTSPKGAAGLSPKDGENQMTSARIIVKSSFGLRLPCAWSRRRSRSLMSCWPPRWRRCSSSKLNRSVSTD
jgi:hypothetical protein